MSNLFKTIDNITIPINFYTLVSGAGKTKYMDLNRKAIKYLNLRVFDYDEIITNAIELHSIVDNQKIGFNDINVTTAIGFIMFYYIRKELILVNDKTNDLPIISFESKAFAMLTDSLGLIPLDKCFIAFSEYMDSKFNVKILFKYCIYEPIINVTTLRQNRKDKMVSALHRGKITNNVADVYINHSAECLSGQKIEIANFIKMFKEKGVRVTSDMVKFNVNDHFSFTEHISNKSGVSDVC